jgi:uncharacterized protein YggE
MPSRFASIVAIAALLVAAADAGRAASAQNVPVPPPAAREGISVVGEGIVLAQPSVARLTLGVEVSNASLAAAQTEASTRMDAVIRKLKAAGIPDPDIRTVSFSVNPQYDQSGGLRAYQVQNLVGVKSADVPGLGTLIDDVVGAGATRLFAISFEADDMAGLKDQARDQAMQNARARAEQLARDAGVSVGRPLTIEESDVGGATPVQAAPRAAAAPAAAPPTPIQPGELEVRTTVRVVWAIQ